MGTDTPISFVLRWALEKLQNRVATPVPVGCSGEVSQHVSQKLMYKPYWMDQAVAWMESKNMTLEGGLGLGGAVTGDKALLDMAETENDKKLMRSATKATGKKWLSHVVSASGRTLATGTSGSG